MARLTFTKRTGNHYDEPITVEGSEVALILIDIWDNHWCGSIAKQTALLAKQVKSMLPLIRKNGVRIIHSPSNCENFYQSHERRNAFLNERVGGSTINQWGDDGDGGAKARVAWTNAFPLQELAKKEPKKNYSRLDPSPPKNPDDPIEHQNWIRKLCPDPNANNRQTWKQEHPDIEILDPDVVAFDTESFRILKFLHGRDIKHLVYAGTATNYCVLWSSNRSIYYMDKLIQRENVPLKLYLARDLTDSAYVPVADSIETHDVGTVESVGAIETLGFPSILSSDLAVASS